MIKNLSFWTLVNQTTMGENKYHSIFYK